MRRSLRRWKTFNAKKKREKKLNRSWGYSGVGEDKIHPSFLEHPKCDCWMCNKRKWSWDNYKTYKRRLRNGERKAIREFYKEHDGAGRQTG